MLLFDGVCNLCNGAVNFIIDHDPKGHFKFAALQSDFGQEKLKELGYNQQDFDSLVLLSEDKVYKKSSAALRIAKKLSGLYPLLYVFIIIPPFIRHGVYDIIAKNRYKWWGKRDSCRMPTPELRARFVDA
ncbi:putative DCC family thiol-disulfide oxidoreductase YuxK [Roseivirga pacifica]|uniref:Predicted thiol-disulfide oxidoreductase YuxK, DCC family n=1 Tax=Roseivirga pacifica TaxID=1267423 RepID=A0A1I0RMP7_9BACT|nr:putative DCC family thiol-disulfide oxidoreductase YuxK [Roseivirga pacifica]SEW42260.1 Predicted thiol-disulfide oxidoreductase YuxK, DCC family [Roseivirga pacifica]